MTKASDATAGLPGSARPEIVFGVFTLLPEHRRLLAGESVVKLGSRALDLLIHLASRPGEVISHRELTAAAWAGAQVEESNLRFQIGQLRKALAEHADGAEHVTSVPGRGYCFTATVMRGGGPEEARVRVPDRPSNLPPGPSLLVGRSADVEALLARLARHRLLTLIGTGGAGKTTLATVVAHELASASGATAYFVDLTMLEDAALVASAIASAVGVPVGSANPLPQVVRVLANTNSLLLLDNCEHVIDTAALAIETIMTGAPGVRVLATSREALRLSDETVYRLQPLATPASEEDDPLAFPAVQLFVERARRQMPDLQLGPPEVRLIARICREVDGLPLAIELVAARAGALGLDALSQLLRGGLGGAGLTQRTSVLRHRSLQATFDWSYALLSDDEARTLRALSVFVGDFFLDAAAAVGGHDNAPGSAATSLSALAEKSRVVTEAGSGSARYRLLQTTRQFAYRKLQAAGEVAAVSRRHAEYFVALLERALMARRIKPGTDGVSEAASEIGNVRAALSWSFGPQGDRDLAVRLAACSAPLFLHLSLLAECEEWTGLALASDTYGALSRQLQLELMAARSAALRYTKGNSEEAMTALREALELAEELKDSEYQIRLLEAFYIFALRTADFKAAMGYAIRGRESAEQPFADTPFATSNWMVGVLDQFMGRPADARRRCTQALRNFPVLRRPAIIRFGIDQRMMAHCANARALWVQGYSDQAATAVEETLLEIRAMRHPVSLCIALLGTIAVTLWSGDVLRATEALETVEELSSRHGLVPYERLGRSLGGSLQLLRGDRDGAIVTLSNGLAALVDVRHQTINSTMQLELAQALIEVGRIDEARVQLAEATARIERDDELALLPEGWRVRGLLLLACRAAREAEAAFRMAARIADEQEALSFRLRAATELAECLAGTGRSGEAQAVLSSVHDAFTEGFATRDLLRARGLLDRLAG